MLCWTGLQVEILVTLSGIFCFSEWFLPSGYWYNEFFKKYRDDLIIWGDRLFKSQMI